MGCKRSELSGRATPRVRDAEPKWGCAYKRCLSLARFVVVTPEGNEWGACRTHLKEVKRVAADR